MTARIRGSKRDELIQKWIRGEDDPDYEVIPTANENKFIIKARKSNKPVEKEEIPETKDIEKQQENQIPTTQPSESQPSEQPSEQQNDDNLDGQIIDIPYDAQMNRRNQDVMNQILEELRITREMKEQKREEKRRKKELKTLTKKQINKYMPAPQITTTNESQQQPSYYPQRRRPNLLERVAY